MTNHSQAAYHITFCVANYRLNIWMSDVDMRSEGKWFVELGSATTTTFVNEEKAKKIIEKSKANKDFWIPAIFSNDRILYVDPSVKCLSTGEKQIWLKRP